MINGGNRLSSAWLAPGGVAFYLKSLRHSVVKRVLREREQGYCVTRSPFTRGNCAQVHNILRWIVDLCAVRNGESGRLSPGC